jgi:hypothetical protein
MKRIVVEKRMGIAKDIGIIKEDKQQLLLLTFLKLKSLES